MKAMGIDFGLKRIGIAFSDETKFLASPFQVYKRKDLQTDLAYFADIIAKNMVDQIVCGLPLNPKWGRRNCKIHAWIHGGINQTNANWACFRWRAHVQRVGGGIVGRARKRLAQAQRKTRFRCRINNFARFFGWPKKKLKGEIWEI